MVRVSNYGGNVCWSPRVDCVCDEERKEGRRIKQYLGYSRKFQKPSCQAIFLICLTHFNGSLDYRIERQFQ